MAQATYAQDKRQLLHFRRTLVSFKSRFCAKGWDRSRLHGGGVQKSQIGHRPYARDPKLRLPATPSAARNYLEKAVDRFALSAIVEARSRSDSPAGFCGQAQR